MTKTEILKLIGILKQYSLVDILIWIQIHPVNIKKSVVNTLIDRAVILSDVKHRHKSLKKVREILENNDYHKKFTVPIIKDRVNKIYNSNSSNSKTTGNKNYVSLHYYSVK